MKKKKGAFLKSILIIILFICIGVFLHIRQEGTEPEEEQNQQVQEEEKEQVEETEPVELEETVTENVEEEPEAEELVLDESKAVAVWTTDDVNFREGPSTDYKIIRMLEGSTELIKYAEVDGWAQVKCEDVIGFVSMNYLSQEKPVVKEEPEPEENESEEPEEVPEQKVEFIPGQHRDPNNIVVVVDPGHQGKGNKEKEPNGPGSSVMKARNTWGATGGTTGVEEYKLCLEVGLKLREELENRGYTVYMTRTSHDVQISNMERALFAAEKGADITLSIHANSAENSSAKGALMVVPSKENPYVSHLAKASQNLGNCVIDSYCEATGFKNRGLLNSDDMTGINWSSNPVTYIELGFMSNPEEDVAMQDETVQNNMIQGMANGIDKYFGL